MFQPNPPNAAATVAPHRFRGSLAGHQLTGLAECDLFFAIEWKGGRVVCNHDNDFTMEASSP
jgi:hypothetical protein